MMLNLFTKKDRIGPIGLDIGHCSIKMIQLCRDGDAVKVLAVEDSPIDPGLQEPSQLRDSIISSIQRMHSQGNFSGRQVVSCLSGDVVKIKSLRMDTDDPAEIERYMRMEVATRLGLNAETDELRYMNAGSVFQGEQIKNEAIFFGVERQAVADHLSLLEEAGLNPTSLDVVPCALFRSFQMSLRRREDRELVSVLVDLGSQFTTVIIGKGQHIIFIKQIPIAGRKMTEDVASALGLGMAEASLLRAKMRSSETSGLDADTARAVIDAMRPSIEHLAREISLCFKYYAVTFRGQRPAEAIFTGGEAYESTLIDSLRRQLGVVVRLAEPLRGIDLLGGGVDRRRNQQMCEWTAAVGLALRGWNIPTQELDKAETEPVGV
jgi:type IV pilus assembly protein PilM